MYNGKCLLTYENYEAYLDFEKTFYTTYDYSQMNMQVDYENDYYAEALLRNELSGTDPYIFTQEELQQGEYCSASLKFDQEDGAFKIVCEGSLFRDADSSSPLSKYLYDAEYIGCKLHIKDIGDYKYLMFYGTKENGCGQPTICMYDEKGELIKMFALSYQEIDNERRQYLMDVSQLRGPVTILFNGGYWIIREM